MQQVPVRYKLLRPKKCGPLVMNKQSNGPYVSSYEKFKHVMGQKP